MTDEQKPKADQREKMENLEPNRQTTQELTKDEAEAAQGGYGNVIIEMRKAGGDPTTAG